MWCSTVVSKCTYLQTIDESEKYWKTMLSTKGKFAETQLLPGLLHEFMKALAPSSGLETSGLQRRKMMGFRWTSLGPLGHFSVCSPNQKPQAVSPSHALQVTINLICPFPPHRSPHVDTRRNLAIVSSLRRSSLGIGRKWTGIAARPRGLSASALQSQVHAKPGSQLPLNLFIGLTCTN